MKTSDKMYLGYKYRLARGDEPYEAMLWVARTFNVSVLVVREIVNTRKK